MRTAASVIGGSESGGGDVENTGVEVLKATEVVRGWLSWFGGVERKFDHTHTGPFKVFHSGCERIDVIAKV